MKEHDKLTFFNHFREPLRHFIGLDIEFSESEHTPGSIDFRIQTTGTAYETTHTLLDELIHDILTVLSSYYREGEALELRHLISLVEEAALFMIFNARTVTINLESYSFIKLLKDISARTYESAHTSLGFFYFQNPHARIEEELTQLQLEYLPFDEPADVKVLVHDKRSLRLIDNQHLSLVMNDRFFVTGFIRKRNDCEMIRNTIISLYDEIDEWKLQHMYYTGLYRYVEQMAQEKDVLPPGAYDPFFKYILTNLSALKSLSYSWQKKAPPFQFIDIHNRELHWYTNHNFTLHLANGAWKVKHHLALKSILLETLLPYHCEQTVLHLAKTYSPLLPSAVDLTIKRIDKMVSLIQRLSQSGQGSLFIIVRHGQPCETALATEHVSYEEAARHIPAEMLLKRDVSLHRFTHVIRKGNRALNMLDCDFSFLELLASIDGAVILDSSFYILSFGELIDITGVRTEALGARTAAAYAASQFGIAIKVSQDGDVLVLHDGKLMIEL